MNHIKLFESFTDEIIDHVDDIAAYMPVSTSSIHVFWCLPNFDISRILTSSNYKKYRDLDKKYYIKTYAFEFKQLSSFFLAESDIQHRSKTYGLKFFILNKNQQDRACRVYFFTNEDWNKLDIPEVTKNINKDNFDILLEEDVKIERNEFDVIYEDEDIIAVKPKTYKSAIKYSADADWKAGLKRNKDWIEKHLKTGSYYAGYKWYKTQKVEVNANSWWRKLLKLPPKQSQKEMKEFFTDFPRYLFYIVIFKNVPIEDDISKLYLLYDINRSEYGEVAKYFTSDYVMFGNYWGDKLDSAHNQVKVVNFAGKRVTFQDVQKRHGGLFNRAFRDIENDVTKEKERLESILGIWADKGGEYLDDAYIFVRSSKEPNRLQLTNRKNLTKKEDGTMQWTRLGYYDDPNFEYWDDEKDTKKAPERQAPNNGEGIKDFFQSMQDDYKELMKALDNGWDVDGVKI